MPVPLRPRRPPRCPTAPDLRRVRGVAVAAAIALSATSATAQSTADATTRVIVTASGAELRLFDTPYAAGVIDADELRAAGPMVNLSEAMARVPGVVANNRHNYAQDLQIHSRGFGARASFGVRGIRLYTDGIPASGPDGQGQVSHFDLAGAQRVEVLRGPFSALYGSSSGGVISLVSAAPTERRWLLGGDVGSDGLWQARAGVEAPFDGGFSLRASASRFEIDGFRPHSSAQRTLGNARLGWDGPRDRVVLIVNALDQPALDPLGLTRTQFETDPDQTTPQALLYDTRKNTRQEQAGLAWRHRFDDAGALSESRVAAYVGQRSVTQWQSIPFTVQSSPTHPGGVIDFDRDYGGVDARLVWRWALAGERSAQLVAGTSVDGSVEHRRGYENFVGTTDADRVLGVTGALRRDERNRVTARDVYAQAEADLARDWTATLGVRHGRVEFRSDDRYLVNGDDSGSRAFGYTNPAAALQWRVTPALNLYVSAGRGFESPTFNELFYRPDGLAGFNTGLNAQTSSQWEAGLKWREPSRGLSLDVAVFDIRTDDEIGVASSSGGRTTFRNVGRTLRQGAEFDLRWRIADAWRAQLAASWLDATYRDTLPSTPIVAGNRIAGTPDAWGYAELAWLPARGVELALEARGQSDVPVNDANTDFAEGFVLAALRARWQRDLGAGRLELLARLDNLAGRRVAGSVIVNEANQRYFEPAPGRTWLLAARWSAPF
nr:TonB-dependent receptor [Calidifontimicrobium sp. SYSU G02091]